MSDHRVVEVRRLAAPAPDRPERDSHALSGELDALMLRWSAWCRSRRCFGAPSPHLGCILAELRTSKSTAPDVGPPIPTSREMALLNRAIAGLPERSRLILEAHYLYRIHPASKVAALLGCSRSSYYRWLKDAAEQAHRASQSMMQG